MFALVALGTPRTGILVAFNEAGVPLNLPLLLVGIGLAAVAGFLLVPSVGDRYLRYMGRIDYTRLSVGILIGLVGLSFLFAGPLGVGAFAVSAALGLLPPRVDCRRVHLMGVLIGPIILAG